MKYVTPVIAALVIVGLGILAYSNGWLSLLTFQKPQAVSTEAGGTPTGTTGLTTSTPPPGLTRVKSGGVLVFNAYTVDLPSDWTFMKEAGPTEDIILDKLTLTSGAYKITIYQAATGGAPCLYPGDSDVEGPSSRFTAFTDITTATGDKLRRSGTDTGSGFTVCELQSGGYGQPTAFGHISVSTPASPSKTMLDTIDSILSSLRKV